MFINIHIGMFRNFSTYPHLFSWRGIKKIENCIVKDKTPKVIVGNVKSDLDNEHESFAANVMIIKD